MKRTYQLSLGNDTDRTIPFELTEHDAVSFLDEDGDIRGRVSFSPEISEEEKRYGHMYSHAAYGSDMRDGVCILVTHEGDRELPAKEQHYRVMSVTELSEAVRAIDHARLAYEIDDIGPEDDLHKRPEY